jgi:hypothetical protein
MRYSLRGLFKTMTCVAVVLALLFYLTVNYRRQLAIRAHLESIGAYAVTFGPGNSICAAFHEPVGSPSIARYNEMAVLDFKEAHVTAKSLDNLAGLEVVGTMIFCLSDLRDEDLARLKQIGQVRDLWLAHTKLTDASVDIIADIPGLKRVDLSNTKISPGAIARLRAARPSLEVFVR